MVSGFICGSHSLPRDEEDQFERKTRSADSSPRRTRSKNPYSDRGLDRFESLLLEIEEKRQEVYSKVDPNEISLVRFVYTDDREFKPIVVKSKQIQKGDHKLEKEHKPAPPRKAFPLRKLCSSSSITVKKDVQKQPIITTKTPIIKKKTNSIYKRMWENQKFYLVVILIWILVSLVAFNRSFAIMCTSIGWYIIPCVSMNSKTSLKKNDFAKKRLNDRKLVYREGTKSFEHPRERVNAGL